MRWGIQRAVDSGASTLPHMLHVLLLAPRSSPPPQTLKKLRTFSFHVRGSRRGFDPPAAAAGALLEGREPSDADAAGAPALVIPEEGSSDKDVEAAQVPWVALLARQGSRLLLLLRLLA